MNCNTVHFVRVLQVTPCFWRVHLSYSGTCLVSIMDQAWYMLLVNIYVCMYIRTYCFFCPWLIYVYDTVHRSALERTTYVPVIANTHLHSLQGVRLLLSSSIVLDLRRCELSVRMYVLYVVISVKNLTTLPSVARGPLFKACRFAALGVCGK